MRTTLTVIAAGVLVIAITSIVQLTSQNSTSLNNRYEVNTELKIEEYLASEFLKFKKEEAQKLYAEKSVSDRVLFHAFVKAKKAEAGK